MATKTTPLKTAKRAPKTIAGNITVIPDEARKKTVALYEKAVKLAQSGSYDKAHTMFNEMLVSAPADLGDRIRMYITRCVSQIDLKEAKFASPEERGDYATALINEGNYEDARKQLESIVADHDDADYAFYGLAVLASISGDQNRCLEMLGESIRLNDKNRLLARTDSDFQDIADNPAFTDLLYPEA